MGKNSKAKRKADRAIQKTVEVSTRGYFLKAKQEEPVIQQNDLSDGSDNLITDESSVAYKEAVYKLVQSWADECFADEEPTKEDKKEDTKEDKKEDTKEVEDTKEDKKEVEDKKEDTKEVEDTKEDKNYTDTLGTYQDYKDDETTLVELKTCGFNSDTNINNITLEKSKSSQDEITDETMKQERMFNFKDLLKHFKNIENKKEETPLEDLHHQKHSDLQKIIHETVKEIDHSSFKFSLSNLSQPQEKLVLEEACKRRMFDFSSIRSLWSKKTNKI